MISVLVHEKLSICSSSDIIISIIKRFYELPIVIKRNKIKGNEFSNSFIYLFIFCKYSIISFIYIYIYIYNHLRIKKKISKYWTLVSITPVSVSVALGLMTRNVDFILPRAYEVELHHRKNNSLLPRTLFCGGEGLTFPFFPSYKI